MAPNSTAETYEIYPIPSVQASRLDRKSIAADRGLSIGETAKFSRPVSCACPVSLPVNSWKKSQELKSQRSCVPPPSPYHHFLTPVIRDDIPQNLNRYPGRSSVERERERCTAVRRAERVPSKSSRESSLVEGGLTGFWLSSRERGDSGALIDSRRALNLAELSDVVREACGRLPSLFGRGEGGGGGPSVRVPRVLSNGGASILPRGEGDEGGGGGSEYARTRATTLVVLGRRSSGARIPRRGMILPPPAPNPSIRRARDRRILRSESCGVADSRLGSSRHF